MSPLLKSTPCTYEHDHFTSARLAAVSPQALVHALTRSNHYLRRFNANNPFRNQGLSRTTLQRSFAKSSTMPSKIPESKNCSPSFTFATNGGAALSEIRPYGPRFTSAMSTLLRSST